jgi:hypothetical protein
MTCGEGALIHLACTIKVWKGPGSRWKGPGSRVQRGEGWGAFAEVRTPVCGSVRDAWL